METDINTIKEISEIKEQENLEFCDFLKRYDIPLEDLDAIVHEIYNRVSREIDCTECGHCCRTFSPILNKEELRILSENIGISILQFEEQYLEEYDENNEYIVMNLPCPFLEGNHCAQYEFRPEACASYPYLHLEDFVFRLNNVLNNYSICPIVYNVYEMLKEKIWTDPNH